MNTNIISAPSKASNVTVLAAVFLAIVVLESLFRNSALLYLVGIAGMSLAFFITEKNTTGLRTCLVACIYSAWFLTGFSWLFFVPAGLIGLSFLFPKAKPLSYYSVVTLLFAHLYLSFKLIGSMERGMDIIWSSFSHMPAGAIAILMITIVYALRLKVAERTDTQTSIKKIIKSAKSMGFLFASIFGGLLTGVFLAAFVAKFVYYV